MAYNRLYTKEKWEKVNKYNKDILNDYIAQIRSEKKSEGSIKQYYNDLRIILIIIMEEMDNKPLYKLTRKMARNMVLYLRDKELSPARINRMLSSFRNIMNFATEDDEFEDDFADCKLNVSRLKGMQKEKTRSIVFLSMQEVEIMFDVLMEQKRYQEATMLALMVDSAGRRNEIYQVTKDSIKEDGNFTNLVTGKRGKTFKLMYHDMTKKAYKLYMEQRGTDDIESLWITGEGEHRVKCSYETLYARVVSWRKILADKTGEFKEFNAHSFRHCCLTLLKNGKHYVCNKLGGKKFELNELQLLAHHESCETTSSYIEKNDEDELLNAFGMI